MSADTRETGVWHSGTSKVLAVGDTVRVDRSVCRADIKGTYRYRVKSIVDHGCQVEVTVFGGRPQHEKWHTFVPAVLHRVRTTADASRSAV